MRFNRAAKVAALPLLAMVLVVALIACQGPIGPKGDKGETVTGDDGTTGTTGPAPVSALTVPVQIFNDVGDMRIVDGTATSDAIDLNTIFTGGTAAGRTFSILSASAVFTGLERSIGGDNDDMLMLSAAADFAATIPGTEDAVILVRAMDTDDGSAVAHIPVRGNAVPVRGSEDTATLFIGTQDRMTEDYGPSDISADPPTWTIKCTVLNVCDVDLSGLYTDFNRADKLMFYEVTDFTDNVDDVATNDIDTDVSEKVLVEPTNNGLKITGLQSTWSDAAEAHQTISVRVWVKDQGGLPLNVVMDVEGEEEDTGFPADIFTITVSVDGEPRMSTAAIESLVMDIDGDAESVGKVRDPEGVAIPTTVIVQVADNALPVLGGVVVVILESNSVDGDDVATVSLAAQSVGSETDGNRQLLTVNSHNTGTATFMVKVVEPAGTNEPQQYAEHTFSVRVRQDTLN